MRLLVVGVISWSLLIGSALGVLAIRNNEVAAARLPLASPQVALPPRMHYLWEHFPTYHNVVPILAYHGVNSKENYLSVTRKRFAQQMLAFHLAGIHTVTMGQYAHYVATGDTSRLPDNPVLLTFDDGRLDSFRGADRTLARFHYRAVMFAVAAFPEARPGWALSWSELADMAKSGRWDIQEHAGTGHHHITVSPTGKRGEFYAYRKWQGDQLESFPEYQHRVTHDVKWGEWMLRQHIPGFRPLAFAVPYSNYGQRATNDSRIPGFFFRFIHSRFPVLVDGDYLDEGTGRPAEIKGRGGHAISYRITQGPADSLPVLACRLRDFVLQVPLWREYSCIQGISGPGSDHPLSSE